MTIYIRLCYFTTYRMILLTIKGILQLHCRFALVALEDSADVGFVIWRPCCLDCLLNEFETRYLLRLLVLVVIGDCTILVRSIVGHIDVY